jgi:hypothetical protein
MLNGRADTTGQSGLETRVIAARIFDETLQRVAEPLRTAKGQPAHGHEPGLDFDGQEAARQLRNVTVRQKTGAVLALPVPAGRLYRDCLSHYDRVRGTQYV